MKRALLIALASLLVAAPARAAERIVDIPGKFFEPAETVALVGDTVTWANHDAVVHDVSANDHSFDSGSLEPGQAYSFVFAQQGTYSYVCSIHRFMFGVVRVYALALAGPSAPVPAGARAVFRGLAPAGTSTVALELLASDGSATQVAGAQAAPDGSFQLVARPSAPAQYRAVAGELLSAPVSVTVGARVDLTVRRAGGHVLVRAVASPSQAGAEIVLERYARELFTWVRVAGARLDARSRAVFRVSLRRGAHLRAVISHGVGGYGAATSRPVVVRPA